jgi:hypothetical protein
MTLNEPAKPSNFIKQIIEQDIANNKHEGRVHTPATFTSGMQNRYALILG